MKITAKIPLKLPNKFYKIVLKYDTFEKATYDSYVIASLINSAKNEKQIFEYIDDITGKGSLNAHFKNLYVKMKNFTSEQIKSILTDSLYPITVVDRKNHFKYYPIFDATRFNGKVYKGNLAEYEALRDMIMPNSKNCRFLSMEFETENGTIKSDIYNAIFSDDGISIDLEDGKYWSITNQDFSLIYNNELEKDLISAYTGKIKTEVKDGNWSVLRNEVLTTINKTRNQYIDADGNHCSIMDEYVKKTEIIMMYDLYFYKENLIEYSKINSKVCEDVVDQLIISKGINEFRTKSLVNILEYVNEKTAQSVVNYILGRKESKEISEIGLKLIKTGLEKGWELEVLKSIKKSASSSEYRHLYRINSDLDFEIYDLLTIDDIDLTNEHRQMKKQYLDEKENIKTQIHVMLGSMTESAVRQNMKKLPTKDAVHKKLNSFFNKYVGHREKDVSSLSMESLIKEFEYIKGIYSNEFQNIKDRCDKLNNK